jgi:methionyl-tRNA formyltransferase
MNATDRKQKGLCVVVFSVLPQAYQMLAAWAERHGHRLLLVVATPGPPARRSFGYRDVVAAAPAGQDILVTTRLRRSTPLLASLNPDLIVSFTFPYRIPPEITSLPTHCAVSLHPAPLPLYRGPNPMRMIYDAHPTLGATLHRTEEGFDTGAIYSRQESPLPENVTPTSVFGAWIPCMQLALEEGIERMLRGEPGAPQDETTATYGAAFTEEEHWLDWNTAARLLQCRATALNLFAPEARALIDGRACRVSGVELLADSEQRGPPGTILDRSAESFVLSTADRPVRVQVTPAAASTSA